MPVRCEPIQLQHQNSPSHRWARYRILPIPSSWRSLQMQLFARHCWSSSRARTYLHPGRRAWNWRCNCSRGHEHPEQGAAHSADTVATSSWRFYEQPRRYSIRYGRCFVSYMYDIIGACSTPSALPWGTCHANTTNLRTMNAWSLSSSAVAATKTTFLREKSV